MCVYRQDSDNETEPSVWSWLPGAEQYVDIHKQNAKRYDQVRDYEQSLPFHKVLLCSSTLQVGKLITDSLDTISDMRSHLLENHVRLESLGSSS